MGNDPEGCSGRPGRGRADRAGSMCMPLLGRASFLCPECPVCLMTYSEVKSWDVEDSELCQSYKRQMFIFLGPWKVKMTFTMTD